MRMERQKSFIPATKGSRKLFVHFKGRKNTKGCSPNTSLLIRRTRKGQRTSTSMGTCMQIDIGLPNKTSLFTQIG